MAKRPKPKLVTSAGEIGQLQYNEAAYAQRNVRVGGVWDILGTFATAKRIGPFGTAMIANPTATPAYVRFGDASVAAPTGVADGIMVPPEDFILLSSGEDTHVRASSASLGLYKMKDNIVIADDDRAGNN